MVFMCKIFKHLFFLATLRAPFIVFNALLFIEFVGAHLQYHLEIYKYWFEV